MSLFLFGGKMNNIEKLNELKELVELLKNVDFDNLPMDLALVHAVETAKLMEMHKEEAKQIEKLINITKQVIVADQIRKNK